MILNVISIPDLLEEIITDEVKQQLADGEEDKVEEISNAINTIQHLPKLSLNKLHQSRIHINKY